MLNKAKSLLEVSQVKKYYYVQESFFSRRRLEIRAVDGVSFALFPSRSVALVGESGCGKTTVAKLILRLIKPTDGRIEFASAISDVHKDVQLVFQNPYNSLNPLMHIEEILSEPMIIHKISSAAGRKGRLIELLGLVGLEVSALKRYPAEFSGGQRQRISIARALTTEPKMIILDEPVSSLDIRLQEQILKLLKNLQVRFQLSFLFITHNLSVVKNFCEDVLVMYLGKIMEHTTTENLFFRPLHPYSEALLLAAREKKGKLKNEMPRFERILGCIFNTRCPYAKDKCFKVEPVLEQKAVNHFAACHFPIKYT